jgi:hypothetical protein
MNYQIQRGTETFGPYTLSELQEYMQAGRVLATDMAQSEGMADWVPVSQILGNIPLPAVPSAAPAVAVEPEVPLPPNLHWAVLLLLLVLGNFLNVVVLFLTWGWAIVLANWARKLINNNKPLVLVAMYPAGFIAGILAFGIGAQAKNPAFVGLGGIFILAGALIYLYGIFKIRDAMEEYYNSRENIALTLSGVMTFFFSIVYLQYHVNRIAKWKKTGVLS